jgi:hypothetical protein
MGPKGPGHLGLSIEGLWGHAQMGGAGHPAQVVGARGSITSAGAARGAPVKDESLALACNPPAAATGTKAKMRAWVSEQRMAWGFECAIGGQRCQLPSSSIARPYIRSWGLAPCQLERSGRCGGHNYSCCRLRHQKMVILLDKLFKLQSNGCTV